MNEGLARFRQILEKLPLRLLEPVFGAIFVASIFLYVALSPLIYVYGLLLCPMVWIEWEKQGKDVLVIDAESPHSRDLMGRISPLISNRAIFLNWSQREQWNRWSLPVQLFDVFGPHGMPERFTESSLPAVIVFRRLRWPKRFTFGRRAKDLDARLEDLRSELS